MGWEEKKMMAGGGGGGKAKTGRDEKALPRLYPEEEGRERSKSGREIGGRRGETTKIFSKSLNNVELLECTENDLSVPLAEKQRAEDSGEDGERKERR